MPLKLDYVSRETLTNVRRNLLLTTASIVTVAVSLSMVGMAFLVRDGVNNATERWRNGIEFEIFLNLDVTEAQKERVLAQLDDTPEVKRTRYITRDEQYELFRRYFEDRPEYLENARAEDLPESIRVEPTVEDAEVIRALGERFDKEPGVKQVEFAYDAVDRALRTSRALQIGMYVVAVVLFLASSLLIFNTIRTAIFARRREIEVMKLVGATNWFIRVPFMVEGLVQGVVGAVAAYIAIFALEGSLSTWIKDNFDQFIGFAVLASQVRALGVVMLLVGAFVGAASAGVAVTRFLDV
jgi:cell division transport system permease protein